MKKDIPIINDPLSSESIMGQNMELFILHKAYLDLTEDDEKKEEQENADKN